MRIMLPILSYLEVVNVLGVRVRIDVDGQVEAVGHVHSHVQRLPNLFVEPLP